MEEPVVGKEKKRRKLDEIVLGLSAAKEQMSEKKPVSPSVTLTLSNKPPSRGPPSTSSSPSPSNKPPDTSYLAEQHSLLLKQQQQLQQQILQQQQALKMQPSSPAAQQVQRKTYEAMIADIAKISSYSHESKVIMFFKIKKKIKRLRHIFKWLENLNIISDSIFVKAINFISKKKYVH